MVIDKFKAKPIERKRGEQLYKPEFNYHGELVEILGIHRQRLDLWQCADCGEAGTWVQMRSTACTKWHKPCPYCGHTIICAWDCKGIWEILGDPRVYIAGGHDG